MGRSASNSIRQLGLNKAALFVVLVAYMFRAFVPAGWMPAAMVGEVDSYIVICTASGLEIIAIEPDGEPSEDEPVHGSDHDGKACPFAAAPKLSLGESETALPPLNWTIGSSSHYAAHFARDGVTRYAGYIAQAPPIFI